MSPERICGMKRHWILHRLVSALLIPAFIMVFVQAACAAGESLTLTFVKAVETAIANNPEIKSAEATVDGKKALKQKTTAAFLPTVDLYTNYLNGDAPSSSLFTSIDQRELKPNTDFNNPGDFTNYESGLRANMQLFNGGRNILSGQIAGDILAASQAAEKAVVNQVTANVMKSWFNVISSERFVRISEETVATIKKQLEIMTVRYQGGSILKSDILSLKVRLAEAQEELIRNTSRSSIANASLAILLGLSPETGFIITADEPFMARFEKTIVKLQNSGTVIRPESLQAEKRVDGAKAADAMTTRNYLPSVQLAGTYYLDDESINYSTDRENWTVGVMMNWNLFSGLSHVADRKKAIADLAAARAEKRKADLAIELDTKKAFLLLAEAAARLDVSDKNRELAEESLVLVKKQYEGGAATITRYLDAELALSKARTRFASAQCDRMSAVVETARAKGLLTEPLALLAGSKNK